MFQENTWDVIVSELITNKHGPNCVRIEVLMATSMMMAICCDMVLCSLVNMDRRFGGAYLSA
jgi:hypothetical protein